MSSQVLSTQAEATEPGLSAWMRFLRAHAALMETSEEARKKFALLKEMLERKLKSEKTPRDKP